jgi:hypothetical protein
MIILEKKDIDPAKKYHFPAAAFKLKEWLTLWINLIFN